MSDADPPLTLLGREENIAPIRYRRPFDIFALLFGLIITIIVGVLISSLIKKKVNINSTYNYNAGWRELFVLFIYFLFIVIISNLLPKLF